MSWDLDETIKGIIVADREALKAHWDRFAEKPLREHETSEILSSFVIAIMTANRPDRADGDLGRFLALSDEIDRRIPKSGAP